MRAYDDAATGAVCRARSNPAAPSPPTSDGGVTWQRRAQGVVVQRATCWGVALLALACSELTEPPRHRRTAPGPSAAEGRAEAPVEPATQVVVEQTPPAPEPADQIEAAHILVSYQGATRAKPTVTRTREEARLLAAALAARAHEPGADFAELAKDASDGPSGVEGGALPRFGRQQMVKPFSDAAFALRPGQISDVVETNFGFHIIKRTR